MTAERFGELEQLADKCIEAEDCEESDMVECAEGLREVLKEIQKLQAMLDGAFL